MKRNFYEPLFCLLSCLLLLTGCVATSGIPAIHATSAPNFSLTGKKTYSWYQEQPVAGLAMGNGFTVELNSHIRKALEEELQEHGWQKVPANPELLLAYDVSVSVPAEKDNPALYAPGFGYSYAHMVGYRYKYSTTSIEGFRPVDLFKQGTLIIDLVEPATNRLLWRGWSEGAIKNFSGSYRNVKKEVASVLNPLFVR